MAPAIYKLTLPRDRPDTEIRVSEPKVAKKKEGSISESSRPASSPIEPLYKAEALGKTLAASPGSLRYNTLI